MFPSGRSLGRVFKRHIDAMEPVYVKVRPGEDYMPGSGVIMEWSTECIAVIAGRAQFKEGTRIIDLILCSLTAR